MKGLAHIHLHKNKSEERHRSDWLKFLEKTTLIAGVLGPLMVIPQIIDIFSAQDATNVSGLSWAAFAILDIPFIVYGFVHKELPIILTYCLFFLANAFVVAGVLLYG